MSNNVWYSFIEKIQMQVGENLSGCLTVVEAELFKRVHVPPFSPSLPVVIFGIDSQNCAQIRSVLMNIYPGDHNIKIFLKMETDQANIVEMSLTHLDVSGLDNGDVFLYIPPLGMYTSFESFQDIVARLRAPDGCPWDRAQTHQSLRDHLLEEAYETLSALDDKDIPHIREELGDLLLQIVLHAQIAREQDEFKMGDIIDGISRKLIHRHPHVFGNVQVDDVSGVLRNWEALKAVERKANGESEDKGLLDGVPVSYPALAQAQEYQERAGRVGFEWENIQGVWDKVMEEIEELKEAPEGERRASELGDLVFAVVNLARWYQVDAESALRETNKRFRQRFRFIELSAKEQGRELNQFSLAELDSLWNQAKLLEKKRGAV